MQRSTLVQYRLYRQYSITICSNGSTTAKPVKHEQVFYGIYDKFFIWQTLFLSCPCKRSANFLSQGLAGGFLASATRLTTTRIHAVPPHPIAQIKALSNSLYTSKIVLYQFLCSIYMLAFEQLYMSQKNVQQTWMVRIRVVIYIIWANY